MKKIQHVRTPTGVLALITATAEKLLKEGVISGQLDGDLHATDAAVVKAAIMSSAVCDFCSTPGATHYFDVPDFGVTFGPDRDSNYSSTKSTGGWMACDACDALVQKNNRAGLIERAISTMAFPKFSRRMIEEFLEKFWQGMDDKADAAGIAAACVDFVEDRSPKLPDVVASSPKAERIEAVMRATGLERRQVVEMLEGKVDRHAILKLVAFKRKCGGGSRRMASVITGSAAPPLPKDMAPHWQRAIDKKFESLKTLEAMLRETERAVATEHSTDLNDPAALKRLIASSQVMLAMQDLQYDQDVKCLRAAETYSFGADPIVAITEAAKLLPRDAPLSSVEIPTGAGWFWFSTPLQIATNDYEDVTNALLWGWTDATVQQKERTDAAFRSSVAMRFSTFTIDERDHPAPATAWSWPLEMTLEEMLAFNRHNYARDYERLGGIRSTTPPARGIEPTMKTIEAISSFFLAACVWFKQKILVSSPGHVERHARKRIMREHKQSEAPSVRVIALRASLREQAAKERTQQEGEQQDTGRKLHVRFVVSGHPRLQRCGPGRADVKLIWIAPYPKGPEDAPFKERQKVFAVIR